VIDAVVFDLDGVLIDSEPVWEEVRHQLVDERAGHWPPDAQARLMGMSTNEWATYLSQELGVGLAPAEVAALVIDRMAERFARRLPLLPGALDALRRLSVHWPLGLASSSPRRLIDAVLARSDLAGLFTVTVSTEEVDRGKPSPDVYLDIAMRLGCEPGSCIAVEDSTNGLRSALSAGFCCVAVPQSRYPVDRAVLEQATIVLSSLDELTVELIESIDR
jgi:HAD superfamily hydrolase (TIGR01509 family)